MTYPNSYKLLRQSAEEALQEKRKKGNYRVVLGYALCSVSVGANEVLRALEETVVECEMENVIIETTGCIGLCFKEPLLDIYTPEGEHYTYELVTAKKARVILVSHVWEHEPMEQWLIKQ